ncbi:MAG: hypothetical protein ACI8VR_001694 [Candidatus Azotimanducaceae bacterium]|jgi:hypothetical protein
MDSAGVADYISMKLLIAMEPNLVCGPQSPTVITALDFGLAFVPTGAVVIVLAMARAAEVNFKAPASVDSVVEVDIAKLKPKRGSRIACLTRGLLVGYRVLPMTSLSSNYTVV